MRPLGPAAFVTRVRAILLRDTGATLSPFSGLPAARRAPKPCPCASNATSENALKVMADYLTGHRACEVESISRARPSKAARTTTLYKKYFPNGGGSIFTFDIKGGKDAAR